MLEFQHSLVLKSVGMNIGGAPPEKRTSSVRCSMQAASTSVKFAKRITECHRFSCDLVVHTIIVGLMQDDTESQKKYKCIER